MKLSSFRELLLKKAQENPDLCILLKYAREDVLADKVLESLEKMARARHKGDNANFAVRDFATEMDPEQEPHMLRDAIGHHVSRYKTALKSGRKELANKHAKQAFNLMNVADVAQKHSNGKLSVDYVPVQPWERSKLNSRYTEDDPKVQEGKYKAGDFKTKTKGLNYALKGNDFSFLQGAPHQSYQKEVKRHGHNKAYPFEQVRINGKYIPVEDIKSEDLKGYEEHPFDAHPILQHFSHSPTARTPEDDKRYIEQRDKYYNESPHIENFWGKQGEVEAKDPEAYAQRGASPSPSVHDDVPGLDLESKFHDEGQGEDDSDHEQESASTTSAPAKTSSSAAADASKQKDYTHTYHAPSGQKIPFHAQKQPGLLDYFKSQKDGKLEEH